MKPTKHSQAATAALPPTETATGANPSIASLPAPDPLAVLGEQLAAANDELKTLRAAHKALEADAFALRSRVQEMETNPLLFALANLDAGLVLKDAGDQLKALCVTVVRREAKGSLTVKLGIEPFKGGSLIMKADVKAVEPKPELPPSIFYADKDGALSRNDPRQSSFNFTVNRNRSNPDKSAVGDAAAYADEPED